MEVRVEEADAADFGAILEWLTKERDDSDHNFIVNAGVIRHYFEKGELYVIRREGVPVAFQAGRYSPQISVVRRDLRGQGLGRALVKWTIADARDNNVCILDIDCQPGSSVPFWRKMGFVIENERHEMLELIGSKAHLMIPRKLELPAGQSVDLLVEFHEEEAKHRGAAPIVSTRLAARRSADGTVHLGERVMARGSGFRAADIHVTLVMDGRTVLSDRAKYHLDEGVNRDAVSGAFYIDALRLCDMKR